MSKYGRLAADVRIMEWMQSKQAGVVTERKRITVLATKRGSEEVNEMDADVFVVTLRHAGLTKEIHGTPNGTIADVLKAAMKRYPMPEPVVDGKAVLEDEKAAYKKALQSAIDKMPAHNGVVSQSNFEPAPLFMGETGTRSDSALATQQAEQDDAAAAAAIDHALGTPALAPVGFDVEEEEIPF